MSSNKKNIVVVGLGYIGLPTAAVLAGVGHRVVGVEVNPHVRDIVNRGEVHIVEPDLDDLVRVAVESGNLRAVQNPEQADAFIIAVPTPFKKQREPDLSFVEQAAKAIAPYLCKGNLVILESTSPVGTTEKLAGWLSSCRPDLVFSAKGGGDVFLAYCPERVLPGKIVSELVQNDRVIGGFSECCASRARALYETFVRGQCIETDARTAEMTKLTENAFRDVNIAFANELSIICDELGVDVWQLIKLANRHPRVNILNPGPGVGGHCIAVDPWFIVDSAPQSARLIHMARLINDGKPGWVMKKIVEAIEASERALGRRAVVACFGLAFKADIDDLRESPALSICEQVIEQHKGTVLVVEPYVDRLPENFQGYLHVEKADFDSAVKKADILVLLVDHQQFKCVDSELLLGKIVIDTRGVWQ